MRLTKHYLMLFGIISLLVLQGASIKLRTQHRALTKAPAGCSSLTGSQTLLFEVGDIDGDGVDDFIVRPRNPTSCHAGDNYVMLSTGSGEFKREDIACSLALNGLDTTLSFGDFDGDGREDIIRTEKGENKGEILFYIASGQFQRVKLPSDYALASESSKVVVGDFNGDGKDDFIRQESGAAAQVFLSTCAPRDVTFTQVTVPDTATCVKIVVADYNGDKKDDFICQQTGKNGDGNTGSLFLSSGDGKFTKKALPESFTVEEGEVPSLLTGDFNQDGKTDFLRQTTCLPNLKEPTRASNWYWTDWTAFTAAQLLTSDGKPKAAASGTGTIYTPTSGAIEVTYTGDANSAVTNGGFTGWNNAAAGVYTKGPNTGDALTFYRAQRTETFKFSQPVINPRIAVYSLGQAALPVTFDFSPLKVKIISSAPQSKTSILETLEGDTKLRGYEGNGIIEIEGTFTEFSFTKMGDENSYSLTVGIPDSIVIPPDHPQYWTDWTSQITAQTLPGRAGSANGTINTNAGAIKVSYTGDSHNGVTNGGWTGWKNAPEGTYVDGPNTGDALALWRSQRKEVFTFSQAIVNPRIAVWSLGSGSNPVTLDFSPYKVNVISSGQSKENNNAGSRLETLDQRTKVRGWEGNGIIQIDGTFTELTFNKIGEENYYSLNIGIQGDACPASSVFVAGDKGEFTNLALPNEWDLDGKHAHLSVGNFNCESRTDFLRQDTGASDDDDTNALTAYISSFQDTNFIEADKFDTTSGVRSSRLSTLFVGNFGGYTRSDYIQYWGDTCYEIVSARYVGGCCNN